MTEMENVVLGTEELSQLTAKRFFKQVQTVKFVNKKVDAIGLVLASTNDLLGNILSDNTDLAELVKHVSQEQGNLNQSSSLILENWKNLINSQESETNVLTGINEQISKNAQLSEERFAQILDVKHDNDNEYVAQLNSFQFKVDELRDSISTLDYSDVLSQLSTIITELNGAAHRQQLEQLSNQEDINRTIAGLQSAARLLAVKIDSYDNLLNSLNKRVKMVSMAVDAVDDKISNLVPKAYNVSLDDIVESFGNTKADITVLDNDKDTESKTEVFTPVEKSGSIQSNTEVSTPVEKSGSIQSSQTVTESVEDTESNETETEASKDDKYELEVQENHRSSRNEPKSKWYNHLLFWKNRGK